MSRTIEEHHNWVEHQTLLDIADWLIETNQINHDSLNEMEDAYHERKI